MEKMKEIWIVWLDGGEDEYYSSQAKAHKRCIDLIFDMVEDRYLIVDYLKELEDYQCVSGFCGYCSETIDPYDEWEKTKKEPMEDIPVENTCTCSCACCGGEEEDESEWEDNANDDDEEECDKQDLSHLYRDSSNGREMFYHIYNKYSIGHPLTMNGRALEFDNVDSAVRFLDSVRKNTNFDLEHAIILRDILYYDGLYIDATNCIVDENGELTEVKGE
jgi:hypothetical protein